MNANNDTRYVIAAVIMAASLMLPSMMGYAWAIYIAFGYLFFNAAIMVFAAGILMNPDTFPHKKDFSQVYRNHLLQFFVNAITAVFLYKVYVDGFVFLAGFFTFMLTISAVSNIFTALANTRKPE